MDPVTIGGLLSIGTKLIDKVLPDKEAAAAAKLRLFELEQAGELAALNVQRDLALGQLEVNKVEAASQDFFRGGWRPAVGWVCAAGLGYQIVLRPLLEWGGMNWLGWKAPPSLEMETLLTLLFGMLGLGGFRTFEKTRK